MSEKSKFENFENTEEIELTEKLKVDMPDLGNCELQYLKTSKKDDNGDRIFGIFVIMFKDGKILDSAKTGAITQDDNLIQTIINRLVAGTVTPCCLCEIIDEMGVA
ncbi:MAG: DUF6514 family protein [Defluviitaleaceae bacterium]|nr:DUF6514 family protein [Defluviitaleaceae bacterium]